MAEPSRYAVAGSPVLHSRSPQLFRAAFAELAIAGHYTRLAAGDAAEVMRMARGLGLAGFNVTAPFKEELASRLAGLDDAAERLRAVNTVLSGEDGAYYGTNTDGAGVVGALRSGGCQLQGKKVVVLGAGGAGLAAVAGLQGAGVREVVLINRTLERAEQAAARLGCVSCPSEQTPQQLAAADVLVSCLPAGSGWVQPEWLHRDLVVLDAEYAHAELGELASAAGCQVVPGTAWLVHQAAVAFEWLTGRNAPLGVMSRAAAAKAALAAGKPHVALVGFMGAGKSTVGRCLAEQLGWGWADTDALVEAAAGCSVRRLFSARGPSHFRELERAAVLEAVARAEPSVVACGGGALLDDQAARAVAERCTVVWLFAPVSGLLGRARSATRPLLPAHASSARAESLYRERSPSYWAAADLVVGVDEPSPQQVALRIGAELLRPT